MAKLKPTSPAGPPMSPPPALPLAVTELTQYTSGAADATTARRVEERLLDSDLHATAAAGLEAAGATAAAAALADLTERLQARVNAPEPEVTLATSQPQLRSTTRSRRLIYWGSGVLVILLGLGLWLQHSYTKFKDEETMAARKRRAANYRGEDAEPKSFLDALFSDDEPTEEQLAQRRADSLATVARVAEVARLRQIEEQRRTELEDQRRAEATAAASVAAAAPTPAPAPRVERPAAEPAIRRMRGQVTTDAGTPISGASVVLRATGKKVAAGADGWYTIDVPAGVDGTLDVEAPGFVAKTTKTNPDGQANVQLSTAEAVAVRSMASAAAAEKRTKSVRPEPEGGYGNYYRYIAGAAKLAPDARKADVRGNVQVEFQVNTDGSLSNFKVVQGLGYGCDEEAVRAIQDGPKWTPGKVNEEAVVKKVSIPVPFGR